MHCVARFRLEAVLSSTFRKKPHAWVKSAVQTLPLTTFARPMSAFLGDGIFGLMLTSLDFAS